MSHTTTIRAVPIRDTRALKSAVADLRAQGVKCELVENQKPRLYSQGQANDLGNCEYVLRLQESRYDVGFKKQADGSYAAVTDLWGGDVGKNIGARCPMPTTEEGRAQHGIGRLMQEYTKHATLNYASDHGMMVENTTMDAAGQLVLTLGGF